jgi:pantetheine-phosphate adenylyltransferase
MAIAIFPGTFDPITLGHIDLITRASRLFDKVIIAVAVNPNKQCLFSADERVALAKASVEDIPQVDVQPFTGLLVDFAQGLKANVIVRGLRAVQDFEYELQIAKMNYHLAPSIDTIYLAPPSHLSFVASSIVREVASLQGNIDALVPPAVRDALKQKYEKR